jgi:hypothetical protein
MSGSGNGYGMMRIGSSFAIESGSMIVSCKVSDEVRNRIRLNASRDRYRLLDFESGVLLRDRDRLWLPLRFSASFDGSFGLSASIGLLLSEVVK